MSLQVKALLVVIVLAVVGYLGIAAVKKRTSYSGGISDEISHIKKMEALGVPPISGKYLDGSEFDPKKVAGKVLIVSFWASWCDPCVKEFPSMIKLVEHFKGELVLIAVSHDYTVSDVERFLNVVKARQPNVEILWDKDGNLAKEFGSSKLPENFIVQRDGKLVRKVIGVEEWFTPEAIQYFERLIK